MCYKLCDFHAVNGCFCLTFCSCILFNSKHTQSIKLQQKTTYSYACLSCAQCRYLNLGKYSVTHGCFCRYDNVNVFFKERKSIKQNYKNTTSICFKTSKKNTFISVVFFSKEKRRKQTPNMWQEPKKQTCFPLTFKTRLNIKLFPVFLFLGLIVGRRKFASQLPL